MSSDEDMDVGESSSNNTAGNVKTNKSVYMPGDHINEDEELVCDRSAYMMYHAMQTGAPCLSFDLINDQNITAATSNSNSNAISGPISSYICAGTQAARSHTNHIIVLKAYNMHPNKQKEEEHEEDDDESSDSEDESEDMKAQLSVSMIKHHGSVNRIRHTHLRNGRHLAASWSSESAVHIYDITTHLDHVSSSTNTKPSTHNDQPLFTFSGHPFEGYAVDWSPTVSGRLATGDCKKNIHVWNMQEGGTWNVDQRPFAGHTASVEDIQWSPNEDNVFISCSVDKSIRVWDVRAAPHKACMLTADNAHELDVNVINWNRGEPFIVSGGDDGVIKVWDLRQFQSGEPVVLFKHHSAPIASVEWHPTESSIFAAAGSDDQLTQWDLAVERDSAHSDAATDEDAPNVPPQLLFIHQGQNDIKELHWHHQHSGVIVSTAHTGFNVFRTISV